MLSRVPEKLACTAFFIALSIAVPWQLNGLLFLVFLAIPSSVAAFRPSASEHRHRFWKFVRYILAVVLLIIILNGVFIRGGPIVISLGPASLTEEGIQFGLNTGTRLLVITTALLLFFSSTPLRSVAGYLQHTGLPSQLVMALLLTLHFLDQLPRRIQTIYTAQEARGAPVRAHLLSRARAFLTILAPLVFSSISESLDRGVALELRGFTTHTSLRIDSTAGAYRITWITILLLIGAVVAVAVSILQWLLK